MIKKYHEFKKTENKTIIRHHCINYRIYWIIMQFWIINQMVFFIINPKILAGIWIPSIVSVILCPHCYEIFSRSDPLRSFPSIWLNNFLLEVLLIVKQSYDWQVKQETDTFLITIYKCASAIVMKLSYQEQL